MKNILTIFAGLLVACASASAEFVYSNGPASIDGPSLVTTSAVAAESFILSSDTMIRGIRFATSEGPGAWDGTLDYYFFDNANVFPSSVPLVEGHNPAMARTFLLNGGLNSYSVVQYDINLKTPLMLAAGTYWFGIHLQHDFAFTAGSTWVSTTTPNAGLSAAAPGGDFHNWQLQQLQVTLGVSDSPLVVPEPRSLAVAALVGLPVLFRRLSRKKALGN
jgi:hypothetical protein